MNVHCAVGLAAACTLGRDPDGRERLVAVAKGTFDLPREGGEPAPAEEQLPLLYADEHLGEPGLSAVAREYDFAPAKPRCDVLFSGCAYAPGGRPAPRVRVGLAVRGLMEKTFDVAGRRVWVRALGSAVPSSPPVAFERLPIHYGVAYGGTDQNPANPDEVGAYDPNPVGVGYYPLSKGAHLEGKPLAATAEPGRDVTKPAGTFRPMALGPLCRSFSERAKLAGTYDQRWLDEEFPFLPRDFQPAYFQAAPADQQIPHPAGGEEVVLHNLTPEGLTTFRLPRMSVPVLFSRSKLEDVRAEMTIDTVAIDGEARQLCLTWRASLPLRRDLFEVDDVVIGRPKPGWLRARATGKVYHASLAALAAARRDEPPLDHDGEVLPIANEPDEGGAR